ALTPGQIGFYVTPPSAPQSIIVDHRSLVDITNQVKTLVSNVSLTGGVFSLDLTMTNNAAATNYVPFVRLNVINVTSPSGTVRANNADNSGSGLGTSNPALFDYSNQLGSDQIFSAAETTSARTLRFADSASEMFQFDVNATAFLNSSNGGGGSQSSQSSGSGGTGSNQGPLSLPGINLLTAKKIHFTVNPLTKAVTAQLALR